MNAETCSLGGETIDV